MQQSADQRTACRCRMRASNLCRLPCAAAEVAQKGACCSQNLTGATAGCCLHVGERGATYCHTVLQEDAIEAELTECEKVWDAVGHYTSPSIASFFVKWLQQAVVLKEEDARAAQACVDASPLDEPSTEIMRGNNGAFERLGLSDNKLPPVGFGPVSCMACVMTSPMQVLGCSPACHV